MIIIVESESTLCKWNIFNHDKEEILRIKTNGLNLEKLNVFEICVILHSAREMFKLKEEIKLLLFYGEEVLSEKNKSNLLLVFKDYFPNARIRIAKETL